LADEMSSAVATKFVSTTAPKVQSTGIGYVPFLDGLRALSVLMILGFHKLGPLTEKISGLVNGWISVDLFFLVSGYLITSILLKEQDKKGSFSLKNFYVRRWLRLCPAYYVFLAIMFVWMLLRGQHDYAAYLIAGSYLSNMDSVFAWGLLAAKTGLLHTWTLGVEEQFYLLWPTCLRKTGRWALAFCLGVCVLVYIWRLVLVVQGASWVRIYEGFDTRIDTIMFGVATCLLWRISALREKVTPFLSRNAIQLVIAATLLLVCHWLTHPGCGVRSEEVLLWAVKMPVVLLLICLLIVSLLANSNTLLGRILSSKPLTWIGRLSYSIYLWHVVVNFPVVNSMIETLCFHRKYIVEAAKYASCLGIASLSYYFIELPFLKVKSKYS
jgi:peptidoglycan/LPS O-acetylase OafA/YrhL